MTPSRHERIVAGIPMRWEEQGAGMPVVLVHGIPTGPALWRRVMPRVEGARLLAWEMVGYAASIAEGRERAIGVATQADYLRQWLDAMGLERVVLAGHDLGGGVAHILAVKHPDRCAGLLLTNCVGFDSWPIPSVKLLRTIGVLVRRFPDIVVKKGIFQMIMRRGHDNQSIASESLEAHWAHYAASFHGSGDALIQQIRALDVRDTLHISPRLNELRGLPARVVWGDADSFQKVEYGERFARELGVPLERIDGGKHFTPEDHPDRIAGALASLVREVQSRAAHHDGISTEQGV